MSLLAIKQHMLQVRMASLSNLCQVFKADAAMLRCMLSHWIKKGKIRQCLKKPACGSKCFKCPTENIEIYEWLE